MNPVLHIKTKAAQSASKARKLSAAPGAVAAAPCAPRGTGTQGRPAGTRPDIPLPHTPERDGLSLPAHAARLEIPAGKCLARLTRGRTAPGDAASRCRGHMDSNEPHEGLSRSSCPSAGRWNENSGVTTSLLPKGVLYTAGCGPGTHGIRANATNESERRMAANLLSACANKSG